jgi:hypothetical protein
MHNIIHANGGALPDDLALIAAHLLCPAPWLDFADDQLFF